MALHLIHGPPNSGRKGLVRECFVESLDRNPVLVVPTLDDVYAFELELSERAATLGGAVMTFGGLFRTVLAAAGAPPGPELTPAQRLRAIAIAIGEQRGGLGPLRRSAFRPGFPAAFARLLDELQESGLSAEEVEASANSLEGSAYLGDLARLFAAYTKVRDRSRRVDAHVIARRAIALLGEAGETWRERPVFLYGFDDLTVNQLELIGSLAARAEVTVALPHEEGNPVLEARGALLGELRELGVASETATEPDPANTPAPLLFHLERNFGAAKAVPRPPDGALRILRSAGERGEAEAIATEVARLLHGGADPAQIAIALRDPQRRGATIASVLESYGIATALEADMPVARTAVGGALIALLEAELGTGRAGDLLRFLRGPSGTGRRRVDWFERAIRRNRIQSAAAALELWEERYEQLPGDLLRLRAAVAGPATELAVEVGRLAATMASRPLRGEEGPALGAGDGLELRAASAISTALTDLSDPGDLAPPPGELAATIAATEFRLWSGPVEGRVRIASPYRLRAARFDHVIVPSLQDGEFPRRGGRDDPFLADAQRQSLGLEPRRDTEAEERYLFHACLALPRHQLFLSYRDSDEDGVAEPRSPFFDDVRRLLDPPPGAGAPDPLESSLLRGRTLAEVVHRVAEAPSETELARALAAHGPNADTASLLGAAMADGATAERVTARIERGRAAEAATRAPGPLSNPAAIEALATVPAYGGTTLEMFDVCSYRWFADHELDPQRLDPDPDSLVQGGLMHEALYRLYEEPPGQEALPRPGSLDAWIARGRQLVGAIAAERELGDHPSERALVRRVSELLARFLAEEAKRAVEGGFEPWLLEATFGDEEESERPALEIDGWRLHGAIDRVDRTADNRALVIDYKLASKVTARQKLEEEAKLQLQLYLVAVAEQWGGRPVGGLYHPLRGTSSRGPRGVILDEVAEELSPYKLTNTDVVDGKEFEELLAEARRRASEIVGRMRRGDIRRDPGPRPGMRGHDVCPPYCDFAPICRRDRAPVESEGEEGEGQ